MPISGPSSYPSTVEFFLAHWLSVNNELGEADMSLLIGDPEDPETIVRTDLEAVHLGLLGFQASVQAALNQEELFRGKVTLGKETLLGLARAYGRKIKGMLPPGSPYLNMMPELPGVSSGQEVFLQPMRDIASSWNILEEEKGIFNLPPAETTRAQFDAALAQLDLDWQALNGKVQELELERDKRNALQERTLEILSRYRPTVESLFAPEDPLYVSIPRLYPLPGHTPEAVKLVAVWDEVEGKFRLTWSASTDKMFNHYQVRMSPTEVYSVDAESVVANIPDVDVLEYLTTEGLLSPGSTVSFKVYVILDTDNEHGSNAVSVIKP